MKKNYEFVVGLDVSKDKLDYCIINQSTLHQDYGQLANTAKGIAAFLSSVVKKLKGKREGIIFFLENTGVYSMRGRKNCTNHLNSFSKKELYSSKLITQSGVLDIF